jgi:hypothetical protein
VEAIVEVVEASVAVVAIVEVVEVVVEVVVVVAEALVQVPRSSLNPMFAFQESTFNVERTTFS